MAAPEKVTHNNTESTADPTQVTTHTQNSMDTDTLTNYEEENVGERGDDDVDYTIASPNDLGLGCVSR